MISELLKQRILKIKLILIDNDGVLTDGRIVFGDYGDELKFFDVQDGHGLVMLKRAGLVSVIVSGKKSRINTRRAKEVEVAKVYQNVHDKLKLLPKILSKFRATHEETCYIGDDLVDIPVMKRVGFSVAVKNAVPEVKEAAHYVTDRWGGRGAVRETADLVLKTQGKWDEVTRRYFK